MSRKPSADCEKVQDENDEESKEEVQKMQGVVVEGSVDRSVGRDDRVRVDALGVHLGIQLSFVVRAAGEAGWSLFADKREHS